MNFNKSFTKYGLLPAAMLSLVVLAATGMPTNEDQHTFSYIGQLSQKGIPYSGSADVSFTLWDARTGGSTVSTTQRMKNINIKDGMFKLPLSFDDSVFATNTSRWLEVSVRAPSGKGSFTTLTPRREVARSGSIDGSNNNNRLDNENENIQLMAPDWFINAPNSIYLNIDSDNNSTTAILEIAKDRTGDTSGMSLFKVQEDGKVGIGTTTPTEMLTVAGVIESLSGGIKFPDLTVQVTAFDGTIDWANIFNIPAGFADGIDDASFIWQDAWSNSTNYAIDDVVYYSGSSFVAIVANLNEPPDVNPQSWSMMAQQGAVGPLGPEGPIGPQGPQGPPGQDGTDALWQISGSTMYYNGGNIGIGTATPNTILHVKAPSWNALTVEASSNDPALQLTSNWTSINDDWTMRMDVSQSDKLQFRYDNSAKLTMTTAGNVGIGTTAPQNTLHVVGSGERTIFGQNTASSGATYGVRGESASTIGMGVFGEATATSGLNIGVWGVSNSTTGQGVFGMATATSGSGIGVLGRSDSPFGQGILGWVTSTSGHNTIGVQGRSASTGGWGVFGWATANSGNTIGVRGESASTSGWGISGRAVSFSGNTIGVRGESISDSGTGVFGRVGSLSGNTIGVQGHSNSTSGFDFFASGAGTNYGSSSSIRWKSNIRNINEPLDKIARLRGVYYDWDKGHGGHHDVGMIAEEVGAVLPEIVGYEENGIDAIGMDYSKLTPLLVEAVNALRTEKDSQIALRDIKIEELEEQNQKLESRLTQLEAMMSQILITQESGR